MKRSELIRQLLQAGCVLLRHGARHDIYLNPATGQKQPVPRHNEIDETLARHIQEIPRLELSYRNGRTSPLPAIVFSTCGAPR